MAKFSMNDLLNQQSKKQPVNDAEFTVRNIPIGKIMPTQANKYSVQDIDDLAVSIEALGLLHNLVVKAADADGIYELVSGERRYRACLQLYEAGITQYATIPCKVEVDEAPALSELKLLHANATTRILSYYEKTWQAGRMKELLQSLKAEGYPFKGRLREIVADMFKVSPAQMGRMESINKNLSPEFAEAFKNGDIGITTAYELSTLSEEEQAAALEEYKATGSVEVWNAKEAGSAKKATSSSVPTAPAVSEPPVSQPTMNSRELARVNYAARNCQHGGKCTNADNLITSIRRGNVEGCAGCCSVCRIKDTCEKVGAACKTASPSTPTEPQEAAAQEASVQDKQPPRNVDKQEIIRALRHTARCIENGDALLLGYLRNICIEAATMLEQQEAV